MNKHPDILTSLFHCIPLEPFYGRVECDHAWDNVDQETYVATRRRPSINHPVWQHATLHRQPLTQQYSLFFNPFYDQSLTVMNREAISIWDHFNTPKDWRTLPDTWVYYAELMYSQGLLESEEDVQCRQIGRTTTMSVWLHVTNACNLRCDYCYIAKSKDHMSTEVGFAAIDSIIRSAIIGDFHHVKLKFSGGEATLNLPLVYALHDYAVSKIDKVGLTLESVILSNGVNLDSQAIENLLTRNIHVMISLDGIREVHDRNRQFASGKGSFYKVARTIHTLKNRGLPLFVSVTISDRNVADLLDTVRFLLENDLPFNLNFFRENSCISQSVIDLKMEDEKLIQAMFQVFDLIEEHLPVYSFLDSLLDRSQFSMRHNKTCGVGESYLVVDHQGNVAKCHMDISNPVTNVFVEDPLSLVKADTLHIQNPSVYEKEDCHYCEWREWCTGGCPLSAYYATGRYDVKSPYCNVYKAIYPRLLRLEGLRLLKWNSTPFFLLDTSSELNAVQNEARSFLCNKFSSEINAI